MKQSFPEYKNFTQKDWEMLVSMQLKGLTNHQIAKKLHFTKHAIVYAKSLLKLTETIIKMKCNQCHKIKPPEAFSKESVRLRNRNPKRKMSCKECTTKNSMNASYRKLNDLKRKISGVGYEGF